MLERRGYLTPHSQVYLAEKREEVITGKKKVREYKSAQDFMDVSDPLCRVV